MTVACLYSRTTWPARTSRTAPLDWSGLAFRMRMKPRSKNFGWNTSTGMKRIYLFVRRSFPILEDLLDELDAGSRPWGIVTNKPMRMTDPLLAGLGLSQRVACSISGDTIPERKPDPAPLLLASKQIGVPAKKTVYVGDAARDIDAGRAAGMFTIAATYGYIPADEDPADWQADLTASDTAELTNYLLKGVSLDS